MPVDLDTDAYLARLGIADPGPPSVAGLHALHTAHVERVAYEILDVQLGEVASIEPYDSARRVTGRHRGGYCYHLNGAFSLLLAELGYDVVRHRGGVQNRADPVPPGPVLANHLALTVHGLPAPRCPSGDWLVDVGLGDALHGPLPLHEGTYRQGPLEFRMSRSLVAPGGWRFDHDPLGSFAGMDFGPEPAGMDEFAARHLHLSTSPDSGFVRICAVQRRDAGGVDALTGCVLRRIGTGARTRVLETRTEWFDVLSGVFGLPLTDLDAPSRDLLWHRVRTAHDAWLSGRPA